MRGKRYFFSKNNFGEWAKNPNADTEIRDKRNIFGRLMGSKEKFGVIMTDDKTIPKTM